MTIWKYTLNDAREELELPAGAKVLSVQVQYNSVCLWALVHPGNPVEPRVFRTYGTGHPIGDSPGTFLGTVQFANGEEIYHIFEETPLP